MTLTSGTKLGPYEIQAPLGAGGMGEVYRARDSRLDRTVAIKVLPSHLNSSSDFRARFEREAKAISGLQHPNICVLYDVGSQEGIDFLVMEYLEGETLYARLARKPLAADEALKIAVEIADALEKAHRNGIVHRDLKPGNVMLIKGGAKLMDFGLAKPNALAGGPQSGAPSISSMATMAATMANMASPVTVAGTVVGTMQYMSPEQIQGKEADARSDIFAFGAMLYEMLSGKRAFQGKSQLSLASAILEKDPEPIATLQPMTPPALENVVRTCLAKEPDDRFQSAHDLKLQLRWIAAGGSQVSAPAVVSSKRRKTVTALTAAMVAGWVVAAATAALLLIYANRATSAQQPVHASIEEPKGFHYLYVIDGAPVLSPDGQQLAMVAAQQASSGQKIDSRMIFVRRISASEAQAVAGTQGGTFPFWSPDGKYIGFFADGKLKKVEATGGPAQVICDAPDGRGGSWSSRGTIVFAPRIEGPMVAVSDGGGTPTELTAARKDTVGFTNRNPLFLPDGRHFLYTARGGKDPVGGVYAASLDGGEPQQILPVGSNVAYSDGYLFYLTEGTLTAQKFNAGGLRFEGKPISVAANVEYYNPRDIGYFSANHNVLIYRIATVQNRELVWLDPTGKEIEHWGDPEPYTGGTFSPASEMAVLYRANPNGRGNSLWLADTQRKTASRLTPDSDQDQTGIVAADGNSAFITSTSGYSSSLLRRWLTGSGNEEKLSEGGRGYAYVVSTSRDGRYVFFDQQDPKTSFDIYYLDLQGDKKVVPLLTSPYAERDVRLSPDDKWMAYTSDESGREELYVAGFPSAGSKWQVSNGGITSRDNGNVFDWSPDGKNLRYQLGDKIFNVEVRDDGGKLAFSPPKELATLAPNLLVLSILPDGKRNLAARPTGDSVSAPLDLVLNWQHLMR